MSAPDVSFAVVYHICDAERIWREEEWRPTASAEPGYTCDHGWLCHKDSYDGDPEDYGCWQCDEQDVPLRETLIVDCPMCGELILAEHFRDHYMECGS